MEHGEVTLASLRRELRSRVAGRGRRYEPGLKARLIAYAVRRRREGIAVQAIARELGVVFETVRRWCVATAPAPAMREVQISPEPSSRTFTAVSPSGVRVEGLTLEDAAALLRAVR
jgi:transposase-like protein